MTAADYAAGKPVEPPSDLIKLWNWRTYWRDFGMTPVKGTMSEQPAQFVRRAYYLESVYQLMKDWYDHKGDNFNESQRKLFDYIMRLRKQHVSTR